MYPPETLSENAVGGDIKPREFSEVAALGTNKPFHDRSQSSNSSVIASTSLSHDEMVNSSIFAIPQWNLWVSDESLSALCSNNATRHDRYRWIGEIPLGSIMCAPGMADRQ